MLRAALLVLAGATALTVKDCAPDSLFQLTDISVSPTDPSPGETFDLHLEWTVPETLTVNGGTAEYAVTYNYIPFSPTVEPLCQDIPCPMGPGTYKNDTKSTWPSGISGLVTSTMRWFSPENAVLACVELSGMVGAAKNTSAPATLASPVRNSSTALVTYRRYRQLRGYSA